jgi:hypothetical protein
MRPGFYDGYEVYFGCPAHEQPFPTVFVRGTGTRAFEQPSEADLLQAWKQGGDSALDHMRWSAEAAFWDVARSVRVAAGVRSVWAVAGVAPCKASGWWHGWTVGLQMNDWHDVDAAVLGVGSWFAREHYSGEVVLRIEPRHRSVLL